MSRTFAVQIDLRGRVVLVVGATGEVAAKVPRLVRAGARVRVVTDGEVDEVVAAEVATGAVELQRRAFSWTDLEGAWLVYVGAGHDALDDALFAWAKRESRLLCTVDRPATCTFISPAVVDLPDLQVAVGTHGASPGVAKRIREDLEAAFGDRRFATFMTRLRRLREALPRGQRAARLSRAVEGFHVHVALVFPEWFERDEEP